MLPQFLLPHSQESESDIAGELAEAMDVVEEALNNEDDCNPNNDNVDEPQSSQNKVEEEAEVEWKNIAELLLSEPEESTSRQRLEVFLEFAQHREVAQQKLEAAYAVFQAALDASLERVLAVAVPVHAHLYDKLIQAERDLLHHFASNHAARQAILQTLHDHNDQWQRQYEGFLSRILPIGQDESQVLLDGAIHDKHSPNGSNSKGVEADTGADANLNNDQAVVGGGNDEDVIPEPDWEALLELDPSSRDKVHLFLQGRDRWQAACQQFSNALDEIQEQLKESHSNTLQTIAQAYNRICEDLDKQEADIKAHIVSNFQRRRELEKALEEAAKQNQNIFARLMARVGGGGMPTTASTNGSQQPHAEKPKGGGILLMNSLSHVFQRGNKRKQR